MCHVTDDHGTVAGGRASERPQPRGTGRAIRRVQRESTAKLEAISMGLRSVIHEIGAENVQNAHICLDPFWAAAPATKAAESSQLRHSSG